MRNCYVTGGVLISFVISRSTGVSTATAIKTMFIHKNHEDVIGYNKLPTDHKEVPRDVALTKKAGNDPKK